MSELLNSCNSSHKWYLAVCGMTFLADGHPPPHPVALTPAINVEAV